MRKRTCLGSNPPGSTRPTNAAKAFRSRLRLLGSLASAGCGSHSRPPHRRVPSRRFHAHTLPSAMPLTTTSPATATDNAATAPSARRTCARRAMFDAATSAAVDARAPDLALSTRRVIVSSEIASSSPRSHTHTRAHPGSAGHAPPAHTAVPSGETAREKTSNPSGACAWPHSNLNPVWRKSLGSMPCEARPSPPAPSAMARPPSLRRRTPSETSRPADVAAEKSRQTRRRSRGDRHSETRVDDAP